MRICIVGAGAIGGFLGGRLALAGEDVTLIARGAHLAALKQGSFRIRARHSPEQRVPKVAAHASLLEADGAYDLVVLTLKAHQIPAIASDLPALFGDKTLLMALQNGIPWWYFDNHGGRLEGTRIEAVDPGGVISQHAPADRIIGASVYQSASVLEPGLIEYVENPSNRLILGELDNTMSSRLAVLVEVLTKAGLNAIATRDIRTEKWNKLLGNIVFNPLGALAHSTQPEICRVPESRRLALAMMNEAIAIAAKLGVHEVISAEQRIADTERANKDTRSSMRQDAEAGRSLELEPLLGAVIELGRLTGTPAPNIEAVYGCAKLLANTIETRRVRVITQPLERQD